MAPRSAQPADSPLVQVIIGPVSATAARIWTERMLANLGQLRIDSRALPFQLPTEVADAFEGLLQGWRAHADVGEVFEWSAEMGADEVARLVQYWANLDSLTDAQVDALGLAWAPAEARPFFDSLAHAVADALAGGGPGESFAALLVEHTAHPVREVESGP